VPNRLNTFGYLNQNTMKSVFLTLALCVMIITLQAQKTKKHYTLPQADSLFTAQQWNAAIPAYEAVLKTALVNALAWNRLGFSYHNTGNYDKALTSYQRALTHNPAPTLLPVIHSRIARIYSIKKDNVNAFAELDKALTAGYVNRGELQNHQDFASLRQDDRFEPLVKRTEQNAMPCLGLAQARQFDFWIGEWDAYVTGTSNLAGHSRIERASGGCMILENWTSLGSVPFEGKSMNFVDPSTSKWKQVWIGSNGLNVTEFLNGEYRDGAMRFEFETTNAQNQKQLVHFYFFNENTDQVRQLHETSSDDGKTWVTTYDFTYKRRKA
jgi:tetratricopeptide (TPR) repeat protein